MSELREIREKVLVNVKEVVEQNKEKINEAYEWVMRLLYKAQKEGLLALEYEAGFIPKDMLLSRHIAEMTELVCDGTEPDYLAELMTVKFMANNYTGIEALLYFLYSRSMLMLQAGKNPMKVEDFFNCVVSGTGLVFQKRRRMWEEDCKQKIENWKSVLTDAEKQALSAISQQLKELSEEEWKIIVSHKGFYGFDKVLPYLDETAHLLVKKYMNECRYYVIMRSPSIVREQELKEMALELSALITGLQHGLWKKTRKKGLLDKILKCSDEEIQLLLRNIDNATLVVALKGVNEEVEACFMRNMSLRLQYIVQEVMEYMGPVRLCDVETAQKKILQIAKEYLGWEDKG